MQSDASMIESVIRRVFDDVWKVRKGTEPPTLAAQSLLVETGFDSLEFAIIVAQIEEELGYDPFSVAEEAYYPQTFGEFVGYYEKMKI